MKTMSQVSIKSRERGVVTLTIGILLLILITLVVLQGARVGILEQRISSNEYRAKEAMGAAEAGLGMATEFIKENRTRVRRPNADGGWRDFWVECDADNPCPEVDESSLTGVTYRFNPPDAFSDPFAPLANGASYDIDLFLCQIGTDASGKFDTCIEDTGAGTDPIHQDASEDFAILTTSEGYSADRNQEGDSPFAGSARAEVRQLVATFASLPIATPSPLTAAATIDGGGTFEIVGNPNGGGPGVPISVWSGGDFQMGGSILTCEIDEYLRAGEVSGEEEDAAFSCDISGNSGCNCSEEPLSDADQEHIDVVDANNADDGYAEQTEPFPDDIFEHIFGVPKIDYQQVKEMAEVRTACGADGDDAALDENSTGFYWVEGDCEVQAKAVIGSPLEPVLLVVEGDVTLKGGARLFGIVFAFSCTDDPPCQSENELIAGGRFKVNGTAGFYGALVSDHQMDGTNGTFHVVFNDKIIQRVRGLDSLKSVGQVPGSWTDMLSAN